MLENIGYAVATETPLVIVDVQRLGPSTGAPSVGVAGDVVQVARGSHGDYQIIALSPESPGERDCGCRAEKQNRHEPRGFQTGI